MATEEQLNEDLEGRNGRWRQRRAVEEMAQLEQQKAAEAERERALELKRQARREERAEWNRMQRETEMEWMEAQMRERRADMERQRKAAAEEERERLRAEALESKRRFLRMPRPCISCNSTGRCQECKGTGTISAVYLSSKVSEDGDSRFHGRAIHGCQACGGVRGELEAVPRASACRGGTGNCASCNGEGSLRRSEAEVEAAVTAALEQGCEFLTPRMR